MATLSLATLARHMKEIDICMFITHSSRGSLNCRPMSNNKDVTYKGDSFFFTMEKTRKVKELEALMDAAHTPSESALFQIK